MAGTTKPDPLNLPSLNRAHRETLRLLVLPLLVYAAWLIELFLFNGRISLFVTIDPVMYVLYTLVGCILIGTIVPVILIQRSFRTGSVNLFQIGFRSLRRTFAICTVTLIICFFLLLICCPAGYSRQDLFKLCLLCLPTAIASVMICWVLLGTHLQALVRSGGVLAAVPVGVVITSLLFGLTTLVQTPAAGLREPLVPAILLGMVVALFFFAVRDVFATALLLTTGLALLFPGRADTGILAGALPLVGFCALAALVALLLVHLYFSHRYATVMVVPDQ